MRISRLLWTLCLIRTCQGGNDDQTLKDDRDESLKTSRLIDVSKPDSSLCQSFEYSFADNAIRLIVPRNGHTIKLTSNGSTVWEPSPGETFGYANVYLDRAGQPALVSIIKSTHSGPTCGWYSLEEEKWVTCSNNYLQKMDGLKVPIAVTIPFTIHLENVQDDDTCTTFETTILGAPMRLFYAKPGYTAREVRHGSTIIWRSSGGQECLSCDLHLENEKPSFLLLSIKDGDDELLTFFELFERGKREISLEEFNKRLAKARRIDGHGHNDDRNGSSGSTEEPQKSWWRSLLETLADGIPRMPERVPFDDQVNLIPSEARRMSYKDGRNKKEDGEDDGTSREEPERRRETQGGTVLRRRSYRSVQWV